MATAVGSQDEADAGGQVDTAVWDLARPAGPSRVPGVVISGFRDRGPAPVDHRLDPHPVLTLALACGDSAPVIYDHTGMQQSGSLVTGLGFGSGGAARIRATQVEWLQLRLSPAIARTVLGVGPADLEGSVVSLDDLWGAGRAARLQQQLGETPSWERRFALVEEVLASRFANTHTIAPELSWAWDQIIATQGRIRIDNLATELGWTRKRLWSRFHTHLGLPPKRAATLVRFDHAATRLAVGEETARVAAECGYTDQSHLHRDVVSFTGVTPSSLAGESLVPVDDLPWADHVPRLTGADGG
ncbi:helix-turn-helix domain-containing protein [Streptomyces boninensis]|uniref:helix-turn-helix domain-containing protein n=1 Tax=Streptomyces boninensis TaxID=2039455 RepID=UPI003B218D62